MRTVKKESEVKEYDLVSELAEADQALLAEARQAMEQAYAP